MISKFARKSDEDPFQKSITIDFGCILLQIVSNVSILKKEKDSKRSTKSTVKDIDEKEE